MATASTTAYIDGPHKGEDAYFKTFPLHPYMPGKSSDPLGGLVNYDRFLRVDRTVPIAKMNLLDLLDTIIKQGIYGGGAMIICHGDKEGLHIPLIPGGEGWNVGTSAEGLGVVQHLLSSATITAAAKLRIPEDKLLKIQEKVRILQKGKIHHLAIRACAVGFNPQVLDNLMKLFNAFSGSAPKLRVFCGDLPTDKVKASFQDDSSKFRARTMSYQTYNDEPNRIAFTTSGGEIGNPNMKITDMELESFGAVDQFVDNYMTPAEKVVKQYRMNGKKKELVYAHQERNFKPGEKIPAYWMWDQVRMIFPRERRFSDNLVYRTNPFVGKDPIK